LGVAPARVCLAQDESASVRGRVTTLSGRPIEQAQVSFFQLEGLHGNSRSEELIQKTFTDRNGEYSVTGLPWGQYRVEAIVQGYGRTEVWRFFVSRSARRVLDIGIPMGMLDHISQMEIRGTVLSSKKEAVKEATVTLTNLYNSTEFQQVRTDVNGRYSLLLMQEGDYVLHASKPGYVARNTTISLRSGGRKTVDLSLRPLQSHKRLQRAH
jgi:uncharacterized surface anchored protein